MIVLPGLAVFAKATHGLETLPLAPHRRSGFAERTQVFARIEAECGERSQGAHAPSFVLRAVRLGSVLHDPQTVPGRDIEDRVHVGGLPIKMNGHDSSRSGRDRGRQRFGVQRQGVFVHIDEADGGPGLGQRRGSCDECVGYGDDFIARLDVHRLIGEAECVGAAVDGHAFRRAHERGEFVLEASDFRTTNERAGLERAPKRGHELFVELGVLPCEVEKRDRIGRLGSALRERVFHSSVPAT